MKNTKKHNRNVSPSEQEEDEERGPMPTSSIKKDLFLKVGGCSPEQINRFPIEVYVESMIDRCNEQFG
ncbi:hypothetical protein TNCV_2167261 [Trichonephila clavipes]|nr:hypothetical protein TNCV_2167261 [Trichonephila clavipes]